LKDLTVFVFYIQTNQLIMAVKLATIFIKFQWNKAK